MENEYPLVLYREGSEIEWHDHKLDTLIVNDAEEEAEAAKDGYQRIGDHLKPKKAAPKDKAEPKAKSAKPEKCDE